MNYKTILGALAIVLGFIGFAPYVRDVLRKTTKPHTFSWLAWAVLEATAFFAQISKGGGVGAWVTAASALIVLFIAGVALLRNDTEINSWDWLAFCGAILGIIFWVLTHNPLLAVIFVSTADALAFVPTFRKSYYKPNEETLWEYFFSVLKWTVGILALQTYNLTTWLYPASLIASNGIFVIVTLLRRKQLKK